jgi:hypothetical protein
MPEIGVPFDERKTLSVMLASDVERHLAQGGKINTVEAQKYVPRANYVRAGVASGLGALDQFLMSSE